MASVNKRRCSRLISLCMVLSCFIVVLMLLATAGLPTSRWVHAPIFVWPVKIPEVKEPDLDYDIICPVDDQLVVMARNGSDSKGVFEVKGIGYSPTPPGKEPSDLYTLHGKFADDIPTQYLYSEDIPMIRSTGANVIRVWEWDFTIDHTDFLDTLWEHKLRIWVPFALTRKLYPDLHDEKVVRSLLMDFNAFAAKYAGYLVGNEVNIEYEGELKTLFPLINKMASIVEKIDSDGRGCTHLLTVPLANIDLSNLLESYYSLMDIPVWSFQLYSDFPEVFDQYQGFMNATGVQKPLVLTEFGADAYNDTERTLPGEEYQTAMIRAMWANITQTPFVAGGCVMEFNDEWWKGNAPDLKNVECPDYKLDHQSSCGSVTGTNAYIHEEYLGMFSQDPEVRSGEYCIESRQVLAALSDEWGGNITQGETYRVCRYYVSLADKPWVYYWIILLIVFLGITAMCSQCYSWYRPPKVMPVVIGAELNDRAKGTVASSIHQAFLRYDKPENIESVEQRLLRLVNDHVYMLARSGDDAVSQIHKSVTEVEYNFDDSVSLEPGSSINTSYQRTTIVAESSSTAKVPSPVEVTYVRYMEGYYIWAGLTSMKDLPQDILQDQEAMIDHLALWMLVQQASGTINHCPELVSAVFHRILLDGEWKSMATSAGVSEMLRPLFAYYYTAIDEEGFSFDDVNMNGIKRSPKNQDFFHRIMHTKPLSGLCGMCANPTPKVEVPDDVFASEFINEVPLTSCHTFRRGWIGSILSFLFNFSWLLRLDGWLILTSWWLQPTAEMPFDQFVQILSVLDALWKLFAVFTQMCLVYPRIELQHAFFFVFRLVLAFAVCVDALIGVIDAEEMGGIVVSWYVILSAVLFFVNWLAVTFRFNVVDGMVRQGRLHSNESGIGWVLRNKAKAIKVGLFVLVRSLFPILVIGVTWALFFLFLVPSFSDVRYGTLCDCPLGDLLQSPEQDYICSLPAKSACTVAIILLWFSGLLVSIVVLYAAFSGLLILTGIIIGKKNYVASLTTWTELHDVFSSLDDQMRVNIGNSWDKLWRAFIEHLDEDWLISEDERTRLLLKQFDVPLENPEASRRVISMVSQFVGLVNSGLVSLGRGQSGKKHLSTALIRTMPSWTVVIPCYAEDVLYTRDQICDRRSETNITMLEYLAAMYQNEWDNFCRRDLQPADNSVNDRNMRTYAEKVLSAFVCGSDMLEGYDSRNGDWVWKVRVWCSCHGQTLSRTMKGLHNYQRALVLLAELAEGSNEEANRVAKQLVEQKYQMIIAHQLYGDKTSWLKARGATNKLEFDNFIEDMSRLQDAFEFDLAYIVKNDSFCQKHHDPSTEMLIPFEEEDVTMIQPPPKGAKPERRTIKITRPGRLPIGEGKPENQLHAIQFATGSVLETMDMNQYCTLENGMIAPFLLCKYFRVFSNNAPYSPKHRVLGFPEHTYTRSLSAVGEFMGMAEFAFVTILQRVLAYPLCMRLHYGHPDFWDAYWVYTRGGPSKATRKVNTNEDIFAGYELLARGESVGYTELLQAQKGRESSFNGSTVFQAKLAQGAAQQIMSRDIYQLNQSLPSQHLLSLFCGSLGFYVNNTLMTVSITCYLYALVLFSLADVTFNQLGLLGAVIAVPWLLQIGFIQMFPVLVELCMQNGIRRGLSHFIVNLPLSLIFFLFHIGTNSYWFVQGMVRGGGGYMSTGRGFGLTRTSTKELMMRYAFSHYYEALSLIFGMIAYFLVADEDISTAIVRLWSIMLVALSWVLAPSLFNPFPDAKSFMPDISQTIKWVSTDFPATYDTDRLYEEFWLQTKSEAKEYNDLKKMWQRPALYENKTLANSSWQFWFWLQRNNQKFRQGLYGIRFIIYILQWAVFTLPIYVLFLVTFLKLWKPESVQLLMMILGIAGVLVWIARVDATVFRTGGLHYGFTVATLLFFVLIWIEFTMEITYAQLLDSLMLQVLVLYLLDDFVRQITFLSLCYSVKERAARYMSYAQYEKMKHEQRRRKDSERRKRGSVELPPEEEGSRNIRIKVGAHTKRPKDADEVAIQETSPLLSTNASSTLAYYGPRNVSRDLSSEGGVRPLQGTRGHFCGIRAFASFYWYRVLRITSTLPKLFPYATIILVALCNMVTVWANTTLTMMNFNGRVNERWMKPAAARVATVPMTAATASLLRQSISIDMADASASVDEEGLGVLRESSRMEEEPTWLEGEQDVLDCTIGDISSSLKRVPIPEGPDCLFIALARAVGEHDHWLVRAQISETLRILAEFQWPDNIPGLSEYLPQDKIQLLDLVDRIMKPHAYGDEACVAAAAFSFNRPIVVLTVAEAMEYSSSRDPDTIGPTIYLAHNGRRHYDVVVRSYEY